MAEPHTTAAGAAAGAAAALPLLWLGARVDALVVGLLAAIFVSIWLPSIDNRLKSAAAVLLSALLAGFGSPVAVAWAVAHVEGVAAAGDALRLLTAALIGAASPTVVPLALRVLSRRVAQQGAGGPGGHP